MGMMDGSNGLTKPKNNSCYVTSRTPKPPPVQLIAEPPIQTVTVDQKTYHVHPDGHVDRIASRMCRYKKQRVYFKLTATPSMAKRARAVARGVV